MRKEITGYLTALINKYDEQADRSRMISNKIITSNIAKELDILLDFVQDKKKPKKAKKTEQWKKIFEELEKKISNYEDIVEYENHKNYELTKEIEELEKSCENFAEVEKNLRKRIEKLENELIVFKIMKNGKEMV